MTTAHESSSVVRARELDRVLLKRGLVRTRAWMFGLVASSAFAAFHAVSWLTDAPERGEMASALAPVPTLPEPSTRAAAPAPRAAPKPSASSTPEPPRTERRVTPALENTENYVIFGIDRRGDGKGPMLADSIIVLVLDRESGHAGLVSVPRDTYVDLGEEKPARINTVLQVAKRTGREPLELGKRVVADTLGLPIRHALALDLGVFERAVDALGGVTVEVPCALRDRFLDAREASGHAWLDVDPGPVRMDGRTAAMYVRSRHGRSDFSRARRQQAVLMGLSAELESAGGVARVPALYREFERSVHTDLKRYQLLDLARRVLAAGPERLHGLVLSHPHVRPLRTEEGSSVLELDPDAVRAAVARLFSYGLPGAIGARKCPPKDAALASPGGGAHSAGAETRRR